MRILVQPERLRQAAQALRRAQEGWQGQAARLRQVFGGLDWETRQQLTVEAQVQQAVSLAESLAGRAGEKAAFLEAAAARFEQADSQGAQALGAVLGASAFSAIGGLHLPLGLSGWLGERIPVTRVVAPSGGGEVAGLGIFASFAWLGSAVKGLADQIWAWLQGRPEKFLSPVPEDEPAIPKGRLAQTILSGLEKARREQEQKQATQGTKIKSPDLQPADPASYPSCVLYAQARRPDLDRPDGTGGAADYITKYRDKAFQVPSQTTDLRDHLATGYAIVWDRHHPSLKGTDGWTWGHIVIVEEVGPDYVIVSQANWPGKPRMKIERQKLIDWVLYVIP